MINAKTFYIKTTSLCNLKCSHCYTSQTNAVRHDLSAKDVISFLLKYKGEYPQTEMATIIFHGAEPLLTPLSELMSVYFLSQKIFPLTRFGLQSNLTLPLSENHLVFFKELGTVGTSWDYSIRFKEKGQEDLWRKNILLLKSQGIKVTVTICLTRPLIKNLDPKVLIDDMISLGVDHMKFERLDSSTPSYLVPEEDDEISYIHRCAESMLQESRHEKIFNATVASVLLSMEEEADEYLCSKDFVTLSSDRTISSCPNTYLRPFGTIEDLETNPNKIRQNTENEVTLEKEYMKKQNKAPKGIECYQSPASATFYLRLKSKFKELDSSLVDGLKFRKTTTHDLKQW